MTVIARRVRIVPALLPLALLLLQGCLVSTAPAESSRELAGTWRYTAVQDTPFSEELEGTLLVSVEGGSSFQGTLEVIGRNQQSGETRRLAGSVSGSFSGAGVVDFDVSVELTPRRHVGQRAGDTISGSWISAAAGAAPASGTFRLVRLTQQQG